MWVSCCFLLSWSMNHVCNSPIYKESWLVLFICIDISVRLGFFIFAVEGQMWIWYNSLLMVHGLLDLLMHNLLKSLKYNSAEVRRSHRPKSSLLFMQDYVFSRRRLDYQVLSNTQLLLVFWVFHLFCHYSRIQFRNTHFSNQVDNSADDLGFHTLLSNQVNHQIYYSMFDVVHRNQNWDFDAMYIWNSIFGVSKSILAYIVL